MSDRESSRSRSNSSGRRSRSGSGSRSRSRSLSPDDDAPTQALGSSARYNSGDEYDPDDQPTQPITQSYSPTQKLDSQDYVPTQALASRDDDMSDDDDDDAPTQAINADVEERKSVHDSDDEEGKASRSVSRSRSRSISRSRSRSKSKSRSISRSRSKSASRSKSKSPSRSKSRSRSKSKSGSRSRSPSVARSKSGSRSRSRSKSISRSKSRSRSKSGEKSRSVSRSRSRSGSKSKSRSRSRSQSNKRGSGSDSELESSKKKVVKEAFGDSDDEGPKDTGEAPALPNLSDSDDESRPTSRVEERRDADDSVSKKRPAADSSDDEVRRSPDRDVGGRGLSDFDLMMEKKRTEQKKRRKKKDIDLINDNDDAIARLIADMRVAAREDRDLNEARQPAIRKIAMLPNVMTQLRKADLQMAFVEANVLSVMTDWLAPMPDKSLPSLRIRQELLKLLLCLRIDDQSRLKESGIGKAVMYLYKHPKEHRDNKELAGKIVANWSRPIFNKSMDHKDFDKEDRKHRDNNILEVKKRRQEEPEEPEEGLRPGDPGWIARARVPMPSGKDYVRRPAWQTDADLTKGVKKKEMTKLDRHMKNAADRKRFAKSNRKAVEMSLEGRKMAL